MKNVTEDVVTLKHLSQQRTEKPKKKKKANKKWKTDSNSNEELNSKRHATHAKQTEKEKEKEELPNQPVDKVAEKRKPNKGPADKPLSKKAKRDKFPLEPGTNEDPAQKSVVTVEDNKESDNSDLEENDLTYECEEVDHENEHIEAKEEVAIRQPVKAARKSNKPLLQSKTEDRALKFEGGASEKRTYQKAFIIRMSTHSFSSLLNDAQTEVVTSMGFAPFLKIDVKQILGKFSKWLVESFDPYAVRFRLLDGQKFSITAFDVHVTLGVALGGTKIIEIIKYSMDDEYNEVHATWLKE
ncbi:LOW QUALITY PROTEIN: hypothetical protein Cgig2_008641 [Carnegiea gigantea]|uniref:Uncharacterized protein n=1 Tax=Carnegiea gigantea TaxID=171969 RepID=A0A9Q1JK03_9CARY|nr:LOW QUALITY PROTEIN: hypothetical protein Cgig2_008641 [Carnegiea gigantea]